MLPRRAAHLGIDDPALEVTTFAGSSSPILELIEGHVAVDLGRVSGDGAPGDLNPMLVGAVIHRDEQDAVQVLVDDVVDTLARQGLPCGRCAR